MVAKATQNLFDVNIGGAGFHVTSHLIALAALFIACFAIAGYITFRDDSVPDSALKSDPQYKVEEFEIDLEGVTPSATNDSVLKQITVLPSNGVFVDATVQVTELSSNATTLVQLATGPAGKTEGQDAGGQDDILSSDLALGTANILYAASVGSTGFGIGSTNTTLYLVNQGTGNGTTKFTSGKVRVVITTLA